MAAGCAPVVSQLACFHELVHHGQTGLVFDHTAPDAEARLATALGELLANPVRRQALSAQARDHARRFDFNECARTVLADLGRLSPPAK
jgi:glycosyltransferase involved in cell wall biosynthesis